MSKFLMFLNAFYLGMGTFFSFYIAPLLFKVLEKDQAGRVVEKVFPIYFLTGFLIMLISTFFGWKVSKSFFLVALLNLLIHGLHRFYILPTASHLKLTDYPAFIKWHGFSVGLNLTGLVLTLFMVILLAKR